MTGGTAVFAAGEEELLAYYLRDINADGEHDFIVPSDLNGLAIVEAYGMSLSIAPNIERSKRQTRSVTFGIDSSSSLTRIF